MIHDNDLTRAQRRAARDGHVPYYNRKPVYRDRTFDRVGFVLGAVVIALAAFFVGTRLWQYFHH